MPAPYVERARAQSYYHCRRHSIITLIYLNMEKKKKHNKKTFTNPGHLADFPAAHFPSGRTACPVGLLLLLEVFPLIVGHMASLVLFNFLEAGSLFWLTDIL